MTDRSEFIGVRLTPDERKKFEDFLREENEFESISRFFRVAAHRYIATADEDQNIDPEELTEAVDSAVTPLSEKLERIEDHVVSIDSNVIDDDKIDRLARDIYSSLPTHSDPSELPDLDEVGLYSNASDLALAQSISTPNIWAQYYDEDLADVRRACARMLEYYPDVSYVEDTTDESDTNVPIHDDISVESTSRYSSEHTDISTESTDSRSSRDVRATNQDKSRIRRYYKMEGE